MVLPASQITMRKKFGEIEGAILMRKGPNGRKNSWSKVRKQNKTDSLVKPSK